MAADPRSGPGLRDLEKELTCSICTDLLYQPLTLLDCLHTYCGSCLKEWFLAQASRRRSSSSVRFTCPACRAVVRETRPNATVTTLLDMVLAANPERSKPAAEKEEIAQRYKHGESIFPTQPSSGTDAAQSDDDDRRLLEEVRELSLRETGAQTSDASRRTRRPTRGSRPGESTESTRRIEHQSSLRSLLSLSDPETMEEEILRQILEEGLLEDIDLDNLGPAEEEELSERIADAYRRRHRLRSRSQQRRDGSARPSGGSRARSQSVQRPAPAPAARESSGNPPVSRPYLLDPLVPHAGQPGHQRHLSDQGSNRRRTSPVPRNPASSSDINIRPTTRSSSDMAADRPRNSHAPRVRTAGTGTPRLRRATESEQAISSVWTEARRQRPGRQSIDSPALATSPVDSAQNGSFSARSEHLLASPARPNFLTPEIGNTNRQDGRSRPSSSRSTASQRLAPYAEPSVACDRCGKQNIQYDLHKKCPKCSNGGYHLCLRCYRAGHGCLKWAGFGTSAKVEHERVRGIPNGDSTTLRDSEHVLLSCRYSRPPASAYRLRRDGREMTDDDPARRYQTGLFCDMCHSPANDCLWKCSQCNEGDWGFCNRCVNQGKCCTHALLPICRINQASAPTNSAPTVNTSSASRSEVEVMKILSFSTNCDICAHPIPASTFRYHCLQCNDGDYDVCANCYLKLVATSKIRKENGHNGWRRCLKGHRMVVVGFEDHEEEQRRVVVRDLVGGYAVKDEHLNASGSSESSPATPSPSTFRSFSTGRDGNIASPKHGIGDWSWKEGSERRKKASRVRNPTQADRDRGSPHSSSEPPTPVASSRRYPPDGGVGLIVHALWSYYPEDEVMDELMFPRGAEITEAENVNEDWYWGRYAGSTGLFPGGHVHVEDEVV